MSKLVVAYEEKGHQVVIKLAMPDLFVEVDGSNIGPYYMNVAAARAGATRHIENIEKERKRA